MIIAQEDFLFYELFLYWLKITFKIDHRRIIANILHVSMYSGFFLYSVKMIEDTYFRNMKKNPWSIRRNATNWTHTCHLPTDHTGWNQSKSQVFVLSAPQTSLKKWIIYLNTFTLYRIYRTWLHVCILIIIFYFCALCLNISEKDLFSYRTPAG